MRKSSHLGSYFLLFLILILLFGCTQIDIHTEYASSLTSESTRTAVSSTPEPTNIPIDSLPASPTTLLLITPTPLLLPAHAVDEYAPESAPSVKAGAEEVTVYITRTGECYHRGDCRYLHSSKIPILKSKAIAQGYRPCKVCRP